MCGFYLLLNRKCSLSVLWPNSLPGFMQSILKHLLRESLMTSTGNDRQWEIEVIYWTFSRIKSYWFWSQESTLCILNKAFKYLYVIHISTPNASFWKRIFFENFTLCEFSEDFVKPAIILLTHHLFVNVGNGVPKWHLPEISVFLC